MMRSHRTEVTFLCCILLSVLTGSTGFVPIISNRIAIPASISPLIIYQPKLKRLHLQDLACAPLVLPDESKKSFRNRWELAVEDMKLNPWSYISIPIVAALVGYITNYVGVKMLFYPIKWRGIPFYRWKDQPFGLIGWQGIVPAKRNAMASKMVDVTISRLLSIPEVFGMLQPTKLASLLAPTVSKSVGKGLIPSFILRIFLRKSSLDMIKNIENVVDIKSIVVSGLTNDPKTIGNFFQQVASKELNFLIESGKGFGFLLGLLQMIQWMFFPYNWTLPVGGAVVGYITNWIALKWIFEPLLPTRVGPFILQGMFLKRQSEVSKEFSEYIAKNVLNSQRVWQSIIGGTKSEEFRRIIARNVPLPSGTIAAIITGLQQNVGAIASHPLHKYTDIRLNLQATLTNRMGLLSPSEFQQVLRPIFQEDEFTLILAGGILGGLAGFLQWSVNIYFQKKKDEIRKLKESEGKKNILIERGIL